MINRKVWWGWRDSATFGAVVLTLKATGEALWFAMAIVRLTTTVRGPISEQCKYQSRASKGHEDKEWRLTVKP